jgi:hypothetical protein
MEGGRFAALLSDASFEIVGMSTEKVSLDAELCSKHEIGMPTDKGSSDAELCSICEKLFYSKFELATHRVIDVITSARTGCKLCQVLWSSLHIDRHQGLLTAAKTTSTVEYEIRPLITFLGDRLLIEWVAADLPPDTEWLICGVLFVPTADIPRIEEFPLSSLDYGLEPKKLQLTNTSSQASMRLAQAWLQYCNVNHSLCRLTHTTTRRLPTRLLELDEISIKLRNGSELPAETLYLTLSHSKALPKLPSP